MKWILSIVLCLLTSQNTSALGAQENEKIYVNLSEITLDPSGIWLNGTSDLIQRGATSLHFDALGFYINYSEQAWLCPKCTFIVPQGIAKCPKCGYPDSAR